MTERDATPAGRAGARPAIELPALMSSVRAWAADTAEAWAAGSLVDGGTTIPEALAMVIHEASAALDTLAADGSAPTLDFDEIDRMEAQAAAATHGQWEVFPDLCGPGGQGVYCPHGGKVAEVGDPYPRSCNNPQESMAFIAAARADVPKLCREVRRLRAQLAALAGPEREAR